MNTQPDLDGLHLLLVEDEYVLALGVADMLVDAGADVLGPVGSVGDALTLIEQVPEIDAAVLDVNLGGETIYPVADALMARNVPFMFATANDRADLPERFRDAPLCRKPFDAQTFRHALAHLTPGATSRAAVRSGVSRN
ncbi:response regulator [Lysobacter korlensis]|uniref:Response regulator n=1 Tax=Lysobacter korlensis TaxID=553636 RepID=A0ABV6RRR2_9GAMM